MSQLFVLSPRYRLDSDFPWLEGIDPSRHCWIRVNGDPDRLAAIPGLLVSSLPQWRQFFEQFRALQPDQTLAIERAAGGCTLYCISENCYAIATEIAGAPVWHLFDRETLESLLRASHPDWIPSPKDVEWGRQLLARALSQPAYAKV